MSTEEKDQSLAITTKDKALVSVADKYEPRNMKELAILCKDIVKSGLAPSDVKNPQDAMILIMTGADLGLNAMQSLNNIHVIKGRPTVGALMKLALVRAHPSCKYFKIVKWTSDGCCVETHREGNDPIKFSFTMEDAKLAGLVSGGTHCMYKKYPKQMLRSRAISTLADTEYPDVTKGLYTPEEAQHIGQAEAVTTDDLNAKFSNKKPEPDEVVDAEFEELDDGEESDESADGDQGIIV